MKSKYVDRGYKDMLLILAAMVFTISWVVVLTLAAHGHGKIQLWIVAVIASVMLHVTERWRFAELREKLREKELSHERD